MRTLFLISFLVSFLAINFLYATDFDASLASSLKIEANHNINRLKSYRSESVNNKIFDKEREKGLGEFLEEQEKWDLIRERGLFNFLNTKKKPTPVEGSAEHKLYLKDKNLSTFNYELNRKVHVKTRDKIRTELPKALNRLENEELQLNNLRPRYEFDKRSKNKWVGISSKLGKNPSTSGANFQNNSPAPIDYPPQSEFPPAPAPYDGFDEVPPPPPMYDGNSGVPYDPAFGGEMSIPPPPPPPDYDF